ncbi:MAG TPA: DUF4294 domain-containing protein, partial [Prolixibacteraceae bacterium]|nr:DUF4294 domain-containing protein [Prolixibacteraceae bacterium]
ILQSENVETSGDTQPKADLLSDTVQHFSFPPVEIEADYLYKKSRHEKKYHRLYEDIKRVYPLSHIVSAEVKMVNAELDSAYKTKNQRKEYLKWYEKHTYNTYIDTLIALNNRQLKLFIKLIDRETGSTPYELIKKYRGGWDAFLWQLSANALMLNLKNDYDPVEDEMIEDIIRKFY